MTESVLAAALSRIGKTVLHLDSNEYYGENWASFTFDAMQNWITKRRNSAHPCQPLNIENLKENEVVHAVKYELNISNIDEKWYNKKDGNSLTIKSPSSGDENSDNTSLEQPESNDDIEEYIKKESRKFNLDLCPKVSY